MAQSGSPKCRVVILSPRGSISPSKASTSPKCLLTPFVFTSASRSPQPVSAAYTNCVVVDNRSVGVVTAATTLCDPASASACVSECISSSLLGKKCESDGRTLSASLQVDGILTSGSQNTSRHGIVSVACRESRVQETTVLSPASSITSLLPPDSNSDDNHLVSSCKNVTGHTYHPSSCVSQVLSDKVSRALVKGSSCETSVHHAVTRTHPATSDVTRTINVMSIRKVCPSVNTQKRSVVLRLFGDRSASSDVQMSEQCPSVNITSDCSTKSLKDIALTASTSATKTFDICSSSTVQRSSGYMTSVTEAVGCRTYSVHPVGAGPAVPVMSDSSIRNNSTSSLSQQVSESMALTLNSSQNTSVVFSGPCMASTPTVHVPAENSSTGGTQSEEDSDNDSVIIIDADMVPLLPSPSRNDKKRSPAAQNVILLNHRVNSSKHDTGTEQSPMKAAVKDRVEKSRQRRKPVLGTRLLESASDEGIILPVSCGSESVSQTSQPNRRKSLPQRRADTSGPQLQFCTKQWKRDITSNCSTTASSVSKSSQQPRSPKKDTSAELSVKADISTVSEQQSSQSDSQCSRNSCDRKKRKRVDSFEPAALREVKRSKRSSPAKPKYRSKNMKINDNVVHNEAAAVDSSITDTSPAGTQLPVSFDSSVATKTSSRGEKKPADTGADLSSELLLLGKDKRSMEMSVTNEDGVVENLLVTIIDISSSDGEEDNSEVEICSLSSAKLDSSEVLMPKVESSQSVKSKSLSSSTGTAVKSVHNKSSMNSRALAADRRSVPANYNKTKPAVRKSQKTTKKLTMGKNVLLRRGSELSVDDQADVTKVKQLTELCRKSDSRKRSKTDNTSTAVKQSKVDNDSVAVGHLGPIVRLYGSKHHPSSCCVVSGDVNNETAAKLKQRRIVLSSSCYQTSFQLRDSEPWRCVFCQQGSNYRTLGDLFGPYYVKMDSPGKSNSVNIQSSPPISPSRSRKKIREGSSATVSQRGHRPLQKYAPSVAQKSPQKRPAKSDKGIPSEIWLHEDCAVWTSGICLSPTGQLCGLEAAISLSLQTVYLLYIAFKTLLQNITEYFDSALR